MTDTQTPARPFENDEIDLLAILARLWEGRWLIVAVTVFFCVVGVMYALWKTPMYRANSLIQVEEKSGSLPGMEGLESVLNSSSSAETEVQLIKSRRVLGQVVENLNLDIVTQPDYFPFVGAAIARRYKSEPGNLAEPLWGEGYAWGGEELVITRMKVPGASGGYVLVARDDQSWDLMNGAGEIVLQGQVGQASEAGSFALMVTRLNARPGTRFNVAKRTRYAATMSLMAGISASEKGKNTGIIELGYMHPNPAMAERVLKEVGEHYVRQNVERNSAEAAKSLEFLRNTLPEVRVELEVAEKRLNDYQVQEGTIDITAEGDALLQQVVALEAQISELEFQRAEIEQRFQPTHPRYKSWVAQMTELRERLDELNQRIGRLPETQQKLVRLRRDVEVGNKIYLQMLSNIQQLDIARAGTVGNVRVVDEAEVNASSPVSPNRSKIVALATLIGGFLGAGLVLVRMVLNRGIENPEEIEKLGIPVYATVPLSRTQDDIARNKLRNHAGAGILAVVDPTDLAVESIRSLRTSLHFGMMDAPNNILMVSGPSPKVGKTFVSMNLAAVSAMANQSVLLIDGDLRRGHFHDVFKVDNEQGLSDLLVGDVTMEAVIRKSEIEGLDFLTRGRIPPNPSELLMSKQFDEFMKSVSAQYDLVIIDTPPIMAVTDPAIVGKHVGMTLLVTRFNANPAKELELTKRRLEQNGVAVKGAIFNAVEKKASAYGYGYGYGYYHYSYSSKKDKAAARG